MLHLDRDFDLAFPSLLRTRLSQATYQSARSRIHIYITASPPAFVNSCCAILFLSHLASLESYLAKPFCFSESPPFNCAYYQYIYISCRSSSLLLFSFSLSLFLSIYLSISIFLSFSLLSTLYFSLHLSVSPFCSRRGKKNSHLFRICHAKIDGKLSDRTLLALAFNCIATL